ncbi:MAG TPA: response regulator [Candidatus Binatia bacterium]|jgi:DNA-binding response OmpR family regulator|nr:response regulator [Candidatus Binatia bacterium]
MVEPIEIPKLHLLLVDDDPVMLQLFGGQFAQKGFEVLYGHDGAEGWEMARKFKPEIILLDYRMTGMDGMEVAEHLKESDDTKNIPVIMFSSEDFSPDGVKALKEIGVTEYLHKGLPFKEILEHVKKVLAAKGIDYIEPVSEY